MSKKIIASLAALVALAVCMVVPALASASPVLADKEGTVKVGSSILGTQTEAIKFTAGSTILSCATSTLTADVVENSGSSIKATVTSVTYTGVGGGKCESNNLGEFTITTEIAKTDWCISSTGSDAFSLQAGACGAAPSTLRFTLDTGIGITCVYTRASVNPVTGTYKTGEANDVLTIGSGAASEYTSTTFGCPGTGSLDGAYTLETEAGGSVWVS